MKIAGRRIVLGLLAASLLTVAGCPAARVEPANSDFRQSRQYAALTVRIETLEAKLNVERQSLAIAQTRADNIERDLQAERNRRQQERLQYDEAIRQNLELKKKLEDVRLDTREIATLRQDVMRLNDLLKQRDAELAKLKGGKPN
ncbi:MAG: hypothetical protein PHU85_07725 [Phycisphaerae bacterium]|nr:hypothetical protein [Phycisphaerae bacterium]